MLFQKAHGMAVTMKVAMSATALVDGMAPYIRYIWTEGPGGTYDAFDDLELVKQWGETNPVITEKYDKSKIKPPTDDIFAFLRGKDAEGNCSKT